MSERLRIDVSAGVIGLAGATGLIIVGWAASAPAEAQDPCGSPSVPATPTIGLIAILLLVLAAGVLVLRRRGGSPPTVAGILIALAIAIGTGAAADNASAVGDDCIEIAEEGADTCRGEKVSDADYSGNADSETFVGTNGRDVMHGHGGGDVFYGNGGDDVICGGSGSDALWGNEGGDRLYGGSGGDNVYAGNGDDHIIPDGGPDDAFDGDGFDTMSTIGDGIDEYYQCLSDGNNNDEDTWIVGDEDVPNSTYAC